MKSYLMVSQHRTTLVLHSSIRVAIMRNLAYQFGDIVKRKVDEIVCKAHKQT